MVYWFLATGFIILIVGMLVAAHRQHRVNRTALLRVVQSSRQQTDELVALAKQVRQFQQALQEGIDQLEAIRSPGRKPGGANPIDHEDTDDSTPPVPRWDVGLDHEDVALPTTALVDARAAWLQHLHASSAAFIQRTERGDEGAAWWKAAQPEGYRSFQLEALRLLVSQPGLNWSDAARCLEMTRTFLRPQRLVSARNVWFVVAALRERPYEHVLQDPSPIHSSRRWKGRYEIWRDKSALPDELERGELRASPQGRSFSG